ncbi:ATP-binding cassette domain-containing protein [Streptomyces sp. MUM 178J]|uniref:ATP-binding cassette domain-containing protein n=1 Tax=Streptomyces sp. MUM 178J TaxID=2791991 RepID=UPI001F04E3BC|nr:ATP-binding cassette domain-containing protein [Streptomyces sp. MUM 178J]WRQ79006.1 ATP-binding cassette domain-containing protein [Streptomyces sp. MUM 178J]
MDSPHGAAVATEDFGLKGPRGWAFRSVDMDAAPGSLIALTGPSGSGRTCLLLALTGRMRPTEGRAEVGGAQLPRKMAAVRGFCALGPVPGVSDLDPALTVAEHLRERALLQRRFDGSLRALLRPRAERADTARRLVDEALEAVELDLSALPRGERTAVRDLERLEELRLSTALALMGRPRLLAVDDADLKLSDPDRAQAWRLLASVAASGTTVLAVCSQPPEGATVVRTDVPEETEQPPVTRQTPRPPETPEPEKPEKPEKANKANKADKPTDPSRSADEDADQSPGAEVDEDAKGADDRHGKADDRHDKADDRHDKADDRHDKNDKKDKREGAADAFAETGRA